MTDRPLADPRRRLAPVVRVAPAKVNLTLAVLGRRPDGYHALHSVMVPIGLSDRLSLAIDPRGSAATDSLHVTGLDVGPAADNLVLRAVAEVRRVVGGAWAGGPGPAPGLAIRLDKRIPVAAGLAGGSSDGFAALDGALEAWGASLDPASFAATAARIGSDVPFFGARGPALVEGRGETVTPLPGLRGAPGILLVTPAMAVSTPAVFAAFDAGGGQGSGSARLTSEHLASEVRTGLRAADLVARAGVLAASNDLVAAAGVVAPALIPFRRALFRLVRRPVGVSGSGPTLWVLYDSADEAEAGAALVRTAVADGTLAAPGRSGPLVVATSILTSTDARTGDEERSTG
jgi:4-diphosphocytidyl-2-C-methyl-D-erythritol kinase